MSAEIIPRSEYAKTIETLVSSAAHIDTIIDVLPLESEEDEMKAGALLVAITKLLKDSDKERLALVKGPKAELARVDADFREPSKRLLSLAQKLRHRIGEAVGKRQAARRAAIAEASSAESPEIANAALARAPESVATPAAGVSTRTVYEPELVDFTALSDEFKAVDWSALKIVAREAAGNEPRAIPGIRWKAVEKTIVRTQ